MIIKFSQKFPVIYTSGINMYGGSDKQPPTIYYSSLSSGEWCLILENNKQNLFWKIFCLVMYALFPKFTILIFKHIKLKIKTIITLPLSAQVCHEDRRLQSEGEWALIQTHSWYFEFAQHWCDTNNFYMAVVFCDLI